MKEPKPRTTIEAFERLQRDLRALGRAIANTPEVRTLLLLARRLRLVRER